MIALFLTAPAALCLLMPAAHSQEPRTLKDKYRVVQVDMFTAPDDLQFPPKYLQAMQDEIVKQLQESKRFAEVLKAGENATQKDAPILQITGTVTRFQPGSQAERYIVGFGAGKTEVFGHLVFKDRASGAAVSATDIRAKVQFGLFGGESIGVTHDFAHRVGEIAAMLLEGKTPDVPMSPAPSPTSSNPVGHVNSEEHVSTNSTPQPPPITDSLATNTAPAPLQAVQHHVAFSSGDFEATQKKLSAEGAAGFRIISFVVTGAKTAEVVLEKAANSTVTYEYAVLHGRTQGGLNSRLNEQAEDGFRLVPNNLALFGGVFACVMEKPSAPRPNRYKYKLHATVRVSSAQHDVEKDQLDGYILEGSATAQYLHIVLLEKEITAPAQTVK
jgi:Domain of unknown function (DUF4410)